MRFVEQLLALVGTLASLVIAIGVWQVVSSQQTMWPLPGLYLIEIVVLSVIALIGVWRGDSFFGAVIWAVVGVLLAFVILGAFSIGLLVLPIDLIFVTTAVLFDMRQRRNILVDLAVGLTAGVAQAVLMLTVIQLL